MSDGLTRWTKEMSIIEKSSSHRQWLEACIFYRIILFRCSNTKRRVKRYFFFVLILWMQNQRVRDDSLTFRFRVHLRMRFDLSLHEHSFTWHERIRSLTFPPIRNVYVRVCVCVPAHSFQFFQSIGSLSNSSVLIQFETICKKPQNKYEINHLHKKLIESSFMCNSIRMHTNTHTHTHQSIHPTIYTHNQEIKRKKERRKKKIAQSDLNAIVRSYIDKPVRALPVQWILTCGR